MLESPSNDATGERRPRTGSVALVCCLLASAAGVVFLVSALWQDAPRAKPPTELVRAAPSARAEVAVRAALEPAATIVAELTPPVDFEARAEASESSIGAGLETAALDGAERTLTLGEPPPPSYPRSRCNDVFVYIVTVAERQPLQSAASLGIGRNGPARLRRPGQRIGDYDVLAITDDWTGLRPDVWLERGGSVCRAQLAGNPDRVQVDPEPRPAAARRRGKR